MSPPVVLDNGVLRVAVTPRVGGTITSIAHKETGLSVLGRTPWDPLDVPLDSLAAPDERTWLTRYGGGWPLLFPNGGDACTFEGAVHGFHGEASIGPWAADVGPATIRLARRFYSVPVSMRREITLEDDLVVIRESALADGERPITVMWGHHPTFGSDLLDGEFEIHTGARSVKVDHGYDSPANPLRPGAMGPWPTVPGKAGPIDLRRYPRGKVAAMAYLLDFEGAWASIRRLDDAVAVALSWDASVFPHAWLWYELGGTADPPWFGRARLIGLEPSTTGSGGGLADAHKRGEDLLILRPGVAVNASVRLHVFKPEGTVPGVDSRGRALPPSA